MGRVHALSGLLLVLMLLLMLHPKAVVIEEYGADGLGLNYTTGSCLGLQVNAMRRGAPLLLLALSVAWAVTTWRGLDERRASRLILGGLCLGLSLGLLLAPGARLGAPMVFTLVSGVSLAMQGAAFFVDRLKNPKDF